MIDNPSQQTQNKQRERERIEFLDCGSLGQPRGIAIGYWRGAHGTF